eukprot:CAMPEP_0203934492 /NCGR_PEP_ID=MMETSP0359-20131031/72429_1 /ASSEMBLY_ACC=CAM_ASM_000338 /TAXON_ID=268821 /ORGANISM="Scrippsiella Hangoei, Strain SHTV-5" /LENGTH=51 /DNA_ID=CAMNT_0050864207 /DNA_START=3 /DNA_END=155 /DNA_ORIENTATION=+
MSEWAQAVQILRKMVDGRWEGNAITYNAAVSACEKGGQWAQALQLFREMAD